MHLNMEIYFTGCLSCSFNCTNSVFHICFIVNKFLLTILDNIIHSLIIFVTLKRGEYALKSGKEIANINDQILQRVTETIDAQNI